MKVVHMTSVHPRYDTRVFQKMCRSLAQRGHVVSLVVADGLGNETLDGVEILDVGKSKSRLRRMLFATARVASKALSVNADIYHFHDPELLIVANWLRLKGKRVFFDSHEDVPAQLSVKPYLNPFTRYLLSRCMLVLERLLVRRLSGVIAATPFIRDKFLGMGARSIDVNNFPLLSEFPEATSWDTRKKRVVYVGGIEKIRGICEMVKALESTSEVESMELCGEFSDPILKEEVKEFPGWSKVSAHGFVNRASVARILSTSTVGLVTLHPTVNYKVALPVKMFEYMAAGLPVIASDFPLWRSIVEESGCGLVVNPLDPKEIAEAIDQILSNPERAREMGESGRRAILGKFNWGVEIGKLLDFYSAEAGKPS